MSRSEYDSLRSNAEVILQAAKEREMMGVKTVPEEGYEIVTNYGWPGYKIVTNGWLGHQTRLSLKNQQCVPAIKWGRFF